MVNAKPRLIPGDERGQVIRELDGYISALKRQQLPPEFIAGVRAAARYLSKEADEPWHGTLSGYGHHGCRRKCCRDAVLKYRHELRARLGNPVKPMAPPPPPGAGRYKGCHRCSECRKFIVDKEYSKRTVRSRPRYFCSPECQLAFVIPRPGSAKRPSRAKAQRKEAA